MLPGIDPFMSLLLCGFLCRFLLGLGIDKALINDDALFIEYPVAAIPQIGAAIAIGPGDNAEPF